MTVVISSGHSKYLRGATGIINETDEARRVVAQTVKSLWNSGVTVFEFHDNTSRTVNENVAEIVNYHNSKSRALDVSIHFNAASPTKDARGVEVFYAETKASDRTVAERLSSAIANASGLRNRGAKPDTQTALKSNFFLRNTNRPAVLIEVCFVDSETDVNIYKNKFNQICKAISDIVAATVGAPQAGGGVRSFPYQQAQPLPFATSAS